MVKIKDFIKKNWLILFIVFIISGWFYWFQYRPVKIRQGCWKWVKKSVITPEQILDFDKYTKARNFQYEDCLRMKGLK